MNIIVLPRFSFLFLLFPHFTGLFQNNANLKQSDIEIRLDVSKNIQCAHFLLEIVFYISSINNSVHLVFYVIQNQRIVFSFAALNTNEYYTFLLDKEIIKSTELEI